MYVPALIAPHAPRDVPVANIAEMFRQFIGNILNWMLFGTLIMQLCEFLASVPDKEMTLDRHVLPELSRDTRGLRSLVYLVFFIDTVQTMLLTHHGWWFTITIWGVPDRFEELVWSASAIPFMAGLSESEFSSYLSSADDSPASAAVQMRIWVLTTSKWMHGVSVMIVLVALTQGLNAMVAALICSQFPVQETLIRLHPQFSTWLAGSLANDVVITVCMIYILTRAKNQATWRPSETLLTKLINRVVQSGSATVVVAAIDLALFVRFPAKNYHYVPSYILGKVYSNAFFLNINLRRPQRDMGHSEHIIYTEPQDSIQFRGGFSNSGTQVSNGTIKFGSHEQFTSTIGDAKEC
ncbi:hypothetical protein B0H14DRAFT_2924639 [Mycena olivaceomarginata]|nr:hypothetical protein B0H14DRAFT_2924639 [Mycena olivaceomarginata]